MTRPAGSERAPAGRGAPRVLVTRPVGQAGGLSALLRAAGCDPVEVPAIAIAPPASYIDLDLAIARLDTYDWIVFTSRNAVAALYARFSAVAPARAMPPRLHCAAIGPGTAAALAAYGVAAAWVPSAFASEVLAEEIPISAGQRVLRLRAAVAAEIGTVLRARGAVVDDVIAYRTIEAPPESVPLLLDAFADGVDAVVLASASAARGLVTLAGAAGIGTRLLEVPVVAIGPVTAEAASAAGLRVEMVAGEYSIDGITAVIRRRLVGA